ncbi:MAG TPA: hypothetical protein VME43_28885 [Bryobacteraceae bacterium]|nr:hypothetical protein [Bryobacteraceae bacterium]
MNAGKNDKKKMMFLGGLGVVLAIVMYVNLFSGPSVPSQEPTVATAPRNAVDEPVTMVGAVPKTAPRPRLANRTNSGEFHPVYIPKRKEDRPDVTTIDPTLRLDLLAKVQAVDLSGGSRNLFAFGQPPPVKVAELPKGKETIVPLGKGGKSEEALTHPAPHGEMPGALNLKYYGIVSLSRGGQKTACFLDNGEEILLATEGDLLKRRYRVLKIGNGSVTMQDTESKREQTIPLTQESKG